MLPGEDRRKAAQYTLYQVLYRILQLLAPITPHITEEIHHAMYSEAKNCNSIHLSPWPMLIERYLDEESEKQGNLIMAVITEVRREKAEKRISLNTQIRRLTIYAEAGDIIEAIRKGKEDILGTCKVASIEVVSEKGEGRKIEPYDISFLTEYRVKSGRDEE